MNLFFHMLGSYLDVSTDSAIGLQSGATEFYLPCVSASAPKWAGLWRISPFRINPLGYHSVATTCHDLQLVKPKGQWIFHVRRASRVITAKFWLEAPWGWLLLYFAKWVSSCSFNLWKKLLVQWGGRISSEACKNMVLIQPWLCMRKSWEYLPLSWLACQNSTEILAWNVCYFSSSLIMWVGSLTQSTTVMGRGDKSVSGTSCSFSGPGGYTKAR